MPSGNLGCRQLYSPEIEEVEAVVEEGDDDPIPLMNVSF